MTLRPALQPLLTQATVVDSRVEAVFFKGLVLDIGDLLPRGDHLVAKHHRRPAAAVLATPTILRSFRVVSRKHPFRWSTDPVWYPVRIHQVHVQVGDAAQ